jgi:hypothetical protein
LDECKKTSYHAAMQPTTNPPSGFKRQVVFRLNAEQWPLREQAATEYGSIQAALIAALDALASSNPQPDRAAEQPGRYAPTGESQLPAVEEASPPDQEISAREAARMLGLKAGTVRGYIRSGRLSGRITTRGATEAYKRKRRSRLSSTGADAG